jgi:hypothetical protein
MMTVFCPGELPPVRDGAAVRREADSQEGQVAARYRGRGHFAGAPRTHGPVEALRVGVGFDAQRSEAGRTGGGDGVLPEPAAEPGAD